MSEPARCPHCDCPLPSPASRPASGLDAVVGEIARIREIAEGRSSRRVEELTLQVQQLQETVARLRSGSATAVTR